MPTPATPTAGSNPSQARKLYWKLEPGPQEGTGTPTSHTGCHLISPSILPPATPPEPDSTGKEWAQHPLQALPKEVEEVQGGEGHWPFSHLNRNSQIRPSPPTKTYPNTDTQPVSSSHCWCSPTIPTVSTSFHPPSCPPTPHHPISTPYLYTPPICNPTLSPSIT